MPTLFAALLAAQTPVSTPPVVVVGAPAPEAKEKRICKSFPRFGTRLQTARTCRTAEEWKLAAEDNEQFRRDLVNSSPDRVE